MNHRKCTHQQSILRLQIFFFSSNSVSVNVKIEGMSGCMECWLKSYMIVPSSAALQNINGTFGAVASRLTRPAWQPNTWVVSWMFTSCTRILQSAAPLTIIESFELGKNWKKGKKKKSKTQKCNGRLIHHEQNAYLDMAV